VFSLARRCFRAVKRMISVSVRTACGEHDAAAERETLAWLREQIRLSRHAYEHAMKEGR
jgi:hypothetical protein